jgi:hypothetical protein
MKSKTNSKSKKSIKENTAFSPGGKDASGVAVVYDRVTGRILETHSTLVVAGATIKKPNLDELLGDARNDDFTLSSTTACNKENLAILELPSNDVAPLNMMVDVGSNTLVPKYRLLLSAKKTELEGDGKDTTEIQIEVVDSKQKHVAGFNADIEIRTSRGKLSERGGRLSLSGGKGKIQLTSVAETVSSVTLSARSLGTPCESAAIHLSFL